MKQFRIHQDAGQCTVYCPNYYKDGKQVGIVMDAEDWKEALENIIECFYEGSVLNDNRRS